MLQQDWTGKLATRESDDFGFNKSAGVEFVDAGQNDRGQS